MQKSEVTFRLSRIDAGQVIEGLIICNENWQKTVDWYDGKLDDLDFNILECNDRCEAENMARVYARLLKVLQSQLLESIDQ